MQQNEPIYKPGDLINCRYEVVSYVARGGMSVVYKVRDQNLNGQAVALKLLDSNLLRDLSSIERFRREAIIARKLEHPNIVRVYDFDVTEHGEYFLTMELVEGTNLNNRLKNISEPLLFDRLVKILFQIASALEHAHQQGVIHRDLKPANVLLTLDERVKIADFGLSRASGFDTTLSSTGECVGTPAYMSPEQIRGDSVDGRSDIYSLGILAYEVCEGTVPFKADNWFKVAEMHLRSPIPRMSAQYPDWYHAMVERCVAKTPDDRFASAKQLLEHLEDHLSFSTGSHKQSDHALAPYFMGAIATFAAAVVVGTVGIGSFMTVPNWRSSPPSVAPAQKVGSSQLQPFTSELPARFKESVKQDFVYPDIDDPTAGTKPASRAPQFQKQNNYEGQNRFAPNPIKEKYMGSQNKFLCRRGGRTILTESIPEGKNWNCQPSQQYGGFQQQQKFDQQMHPDKIARLKELMARRRR